VRRVRRRIDRVERIPVAPAAAGAKRAHAKPAPHAAHASDSPGRAIAPGAPGAEKLLNLQRTVGNQAVQRLLATGSPAIQRLPTARQMISETGKEPKDFIIRGRKKSYQSLVDALETYKYYTLNAEIGTNAQEIDKQLQQMNGYLDQVFSSANAFLSSKKKGKVADFCRKIISHQAQERVMLMQIGMKFSRKPRTGKDFFASPKWYLEIPATFRNINTQQASVGLDTAQETGVGGTGAQKSVNEVKTGTPGGEYKGYFAKDMQLSEFGDNAIGVGGMMEEYGIDQADPRLAARSVAMSRLDALLGAGVIARTEFAVKNTEFGTVMETAKGQKMVDSVETMDMADPNLQRLMSRLQLIDAIAGQVDRHQGNYFVNKDNSGKVTGVTGIDLDMAYGTSGFDVNTPLRCDWYPGTSMLVDKDLAERILQVTEPDLRSIWEGLLSEAEIAAALQRWEALKAHLAGLKSKGKLLAPSEWNAQTAQKLDAEKRSYLAAAMRGKRGEDSRNPLPGG